jgi:hypothetical protein
MLSGMPTAGNTVYRDYNKPGAVAVCCAYLALTNMATNKSSRLCCRERRSEPPMHFHNGFSRADVLGQQRANFRQPRTIDISNIRLVLSGRSEGRKVLAHKGVYVSGVHAG